MSKLLIYFHTLKFLKFSQFWYRALKKCRHPTVNVIKGKCRERVGAWVTHFIYEQKFLDEKTVRFLNRSGSVVDKTAWNDDSSEKLWLYNLHYFDDLNSFGSDDRRDLQAKWIKKWIHDNPASSGGNGWESYTLSLRIVNWSKAFLSGFKYDQNMINSLAQQADFLSQKLERHLLGNHYFVNLKALVFAGCFLDGYAADRWLKVGLNDLERELEEQILEDGGNFELSPMYHAIMLTDLLDLVNLANVFPDKIPSNLVIKIKKKISLMFSWLDSMSHIDRSISFFNDSAFAIAPDNEVINEYAEKLSVPIARGQHTNSKAGFSVNYLADSGYISVDDGYVKLLADVADVGPSYIPGHAHADTLSFEMSLGLSRLFVNSGTSEYGTGKERLRQRSTAAHNTVEINSLNSTEVWSGFRVAKRANIVAFSYPVCSPHRVSFSATHDGYKKIGIKCLHQRSWIFEKCNLLIIDEIDGNFEQAIGYLHLHPDINIIESSISECRLVCGDYFVNISVTNGELSTVDSTWHPEFGKLVPNVALKVKHLANKVSTNIEWLKK